MQADLILCRSHIPYCWTSRVAAHLFTISIMLVSKQILNLVTFELTKFDCIMEANLLIAGHTNLSANNWCIISCDIHFIRR